MTGEGCHGGAARPDGGADRDGADRGCVAVRQAGSRRYPGMDAVGIELQDRASAMLEDFLAQAADPIEHRFQRDAADDRFQDGMFAMGQRLHQLAVGDIDHRPASAGDLPAGVTFHRDMDGDPAKPAIAPADADVVAVIGVSPASTTAKRSRLASLSSCQMKSGSCARCCLERRTPSAAPKRGSGRPACRRPLWRTVPPARCR